MAKGVCNIIVISHIHIYLHCIYVFVYWYHLYDCVYHEINNYFIKLKQFFLFDKEYSTCTMVWKNRTRHNTTCLLFGWRYFFLLGEKYLTSGVYVSRISRKYRCMIQSQHLHVYALYLFHVHHREKMIGLHCSKNEPYKPRNK